MNKYDIRIDEFQATLLRQAVGRLIEAKGIDRKKNYGLESDTQSLAAAELILLEGMLAQNGSNAMGVVGTLNDFTA